MSNSKSEIISKKYNDPSGFGSKQKTLDEAKQIDKTITIDDVKSYIGKACFQPFFEKRF